MHTKLSIYCEKVIEAGWLAAVILVPVFFNIYSARTFEPDKITLMRSIALVMALAWLVKVAEAGLGQSQGDAPRAANGPSQLSIRKWLRAPLFLPTLLVVLAYVVSTIFSISPTVAVWGSYQRLQGTYTALSYIVIFALVASHLRTRAQLDRLMTTVIVTSLPVGLYGIIQHYGRDSLPWAGDVQSRVASSLGNAIFVASYLIMAIPPTLARLTDAMVSILNDEETSWGNTLLGAVYLVILVVDVICVIFSGSRGPWLGMFAGFFFFLFLGLLLVYRRRRPADALTIRRVARSLLETAGPVGLGGLLGVLGFRLMGPVTLAGANLDLWGMLAVGFMAGGALNVAIIALRAALSLSHWRLWLNWVLLAVLMGGLLVALNVPGSPFQSVRSLPTIGRLADLYHPEAGTGRVRVLIWEGVLNLIRPHEPLGIPGEFSDPFDLVRPLIGYGPESMFNAFAKVYPPDLAHVEARGSSADRSHNETFDFLATMGVFGFAAYYWLIFTLFYYLLKSVGWIPDRHARLRLMALLAAGGLLGAFGPFVLTGSFVFSAVGLPAGMVSMIFVYLVWQAFIDRAPDAGDSGAGDVRGSSNGIGPQLALIGMFAALVGHFIEVHFVFSIAATYVYFWVFAGVVAAWASGAFSAQPAPLPAAGASEIGEPQSRPATAPSAVSRRHRRRQKPGGADDEASATASTRIAPPEDWETWLGVYGLVMAILLVGMVYDFVTSQFDVTRGNYSVLWMFSITWGIGMAVGLGEVAVRVRSWQKPIRWGRAVLLFVITSLGYAAFYLLIHTWQLHPGPISGADPIQAALDSTTIVNGLLNLFYVFVVLLLGLIAAMLAMPLFQRQPRLRSANWWLYPVLVLAVGIAILFKNVDVVRADTILKQGEQYRNQGQYDAAIALGKYSVELDSDEDFYYLMLALAYQLKAQDTRITPEARAAAWADGERVALQARDINPYNPDNTGNMGRYYLTWAQATPAEDPQRAGRFQQAINYFDKAIKLAPQNVIYYNLLAQTHYVLGQFDQAVSILQQSVALDAQFDQTQMLLGDTYGAMGRPQDAIQAHRAAIMLNPGAFADQFLDQRINFYLSYPQIQELVAAFKAAITERPKDVLIPRTLAHIYSRMGDHPNAIAYYEQAIGMGDNDLQTFLGVGAEYVTVADFQKAEAVYQRAVEIDPNNVQAHSNLAYSLARLGRFDEAIQENQRVLQIAPDDYISHRNLVLLYRDSGRLDDALQQAQLMIKTTPQNELGPTYVLVGNLYEAAGKPTEAITAYEKAVSAAPGLAQAHMALGNLYLQQGRVEDALRTFQALAQLTPDDYAVHQQLALTYRQLKRWDEALAEAQLALSKAPPDQQPAVQQLVAQIQTEKGQGQ